MEHNLKYDIVVEMYEPDGTFRELSAYETDFVVREDELEPVDDLDLVEGEKVFKGLVVG